MTYRNNSIGMRALITLEKSGNWKVTEYDDAFGYNCGSKTFSSERAAITYLTKNGFFTR